MANKHSRARDKLRPLAQLRRVASIELDHVCDEYGVDPSGSQRRRLVDEAVALADPYVYRGIDAALPAHRGDLRREWYLWRLAGRGKSRAERERMARKLAPVPDVEYHRESAAGLLSYDAVWRSFRARRRRAGLLTH